MAKEELKLVLRKHCTVQGENFTKIKHSDNIYNMSVDQEFELGFGLFEQFFCLFAAFLMFSFSYFYFFRGTA